MKQDHDHHESNLRYKQRVVMEFLVAENESAANIHKRLRRVYGSLAVDRSTVRRWVQRIKDSESVDTELFDRPRCGRPSTATNEKMLKLAEGIILTDSQISIRQLALKLSVSHGSANRIIKTIEKTKFKSMILPDPATQESSRPASPSQCTSSQESDNTGSNHKTDLDCSTPSAL